MHCASSWCEVWAFISWLCLANPEATHNSSVSHLKCTHLAGTPQQGGGEKTPNTSTSQSFHLRHLCMFSFWGLGQIRFTPKTLFCFFESFTPMPHGTSAELLLAPIFFGVIISRNLTRAFCCVASGTAVFSLGSNAQLVESILALQRQSGFNRTEETKAEMTRTIGVLFRLPPPLTLCGQLALHISTPHGG